MLRSYEFFLFLTSFFFIIWKNRCFFVSLQDNNRLELFLFPFIPRNSEVKQKKHTEIHFCNISKPYMLANSFIHSPLPPSCTELGREGGERICFRENRHADKRKESVIGFPAGFVTRRSRVLAYG